MNPNNSSPNMNSPEKKRSRTSLFGQMTNQSNKVTPSASANQPPKSSKSTKEKKEKKKRGVTDR